MDRTAMVRHLRTERFGRQAEFLGQVGSTNDVAQELARAGAPEGTLVVAEEQTAGRGRRGRPWLSHAGAGLWFSLILRPAPATAVLGLTPLAAVATAEVVQAYAGVRLLIKWPNDLLWDGLKVAGFLVEGETGPAGMRFAVLGIGLNVNQRQQAFPPDLRGQATSLAAILGAPVDREGLLAAILNGLEVRYDQVGTEGMPPVLQEARRLSATLGREVMVDEAGKVWTGWAEDLADDGALLIRHVDGELRKLYGGNVSLR